MAVRPVFVIEAKGRSHTVVEYPVEFTWHPGFSISQQRKSIDSMHQVYVDTTGIADILEVSSRATRSEGRQASAFTLRCDPRRIPGVDVDAVNAALDGRAHTPVEVLFQGSKRFSRQSKAANPYHLSPKEARRWAAANNEDGSLLEFVFFGQKFPLQPRTLFYDWLYCHALSQNPRIAGQIEQYRAFTDIAFNPKKSINCQARSAAIYVALSKRGTLEGALASREAFEAAWGEVMEG